MKSKENWIIQKPVFSIKWIGGLAVCLTLGLASCGSDTTDTSRQLGPIPGEDTTAQNMRQTLGLDTTEIGNPDREYGDTVSRVGSVGSQQALDSSRGTPPNQR